MADSNDKWAAWNAKGNSKKGSNWDNADSDYERAERGARDEEDERKRKEKADKEPGVFAGLKKLFGG